MTNSDIAKRLVATTSQQFLEEWDRAVTYAVLRVVAKDVLLHVLKCKCTDVRRKVIKTKSSGGSQP